MSEPEGVTLEDGQKLRHDEVWLVLDDGRVREMRLRVGRGIVREVTRAPLEPVLCALGGYPFVPSMLLHPCTPNEVQDNEIAPETPTDPRTIPVERTMTDE